MVNSKQAVGVCKVFPSNVGELRGMFPNVPGNVSGTFGQPLSCLRVNVANYSTKLASTNIILSRSRLRELLQFV